MYDQANRDIHCLRLSLTESCNLRCCYCRPQEPAALPPQELTDAELLHLVQLFAACGIDTLRLTGGEPLLRAGVPQLTARLKAVPGIRKVTLTTNGTLLPRRGELLLQSPAVHRVSISLHSFEGNESGGDMGAYLDGCFAFARQAAEAGKRCALRLWNLDGAETAGANRQNGAILERMAQTFPRPWKEGWQGVTVAPNIFLEWGERFQWPDLEAGEYAGRAFCRGLRDQVGVLWDGTVVPCCLDHEGDIPLGNLYDGSLEDILSSPRARAIYNGFSQGRAAEALCRRCGYRRRFSK